jgi:hypothetical protein
VDRLEALARIADGLARQLATERAANDQLRAMLARIDPEPPLVRFARTRRWQLLFVLTTCLTALVGASAMVALLGAPAPAPPPASWAAVAAAAPPLSAWQNRAAYGPGRKDLSIPVAATPRRPAPRRPVRRESLSIPSAWLFGDLPELARDAAIERVSARCRASGPFMADVTPAPELGLRRATVRVHRPDALELQGCVERAVRRAASIGRIPRVATRDSTRRFSVLLGAPQDTWTGLEACDDFAARACSGGRQDRCDDAAHLIAAWKELGVAAQRCAPARAWSLPRSARDDRE